MMKGMKGMTSSEDALVIVNPAGRTDTLEFSIAARSAELLDGAVVGIVDNTKVNADLLLNGIVEALGRDHDIKEVVRVRKRTATESVTEAQLDELDRCSLVFTGTGDCGNCTSWSVHDTIELERRGIPAVLVVSEVFEHLARLEAQSLGVPEPSLAVVPHPIGACTSDEIKDRAEIAREKVESLGAHDETSSSGASGSSGERLVTLGGTYEHVWDYLAKSGLSDGLPVVVPTLERVEAMLQYSLLSPDDTLGILAPMGASATVERLAANAVMAGCLPSHFPVVVAAVQALLDPDLDLLGVQATTHPVAPLLVVNGPVAREISINSGAGLFGPGFRANATIGRAVRLILMNVGGARPGLLDKATMGQPGKFSFCIAENELESPWEPLHVQRGFPDWASTVTIVPAEGPHNVLISSSMNAYGVLHPICGAIAQPGTGNGWYDDADIMVILCPEHARTIARDGFSKEQVQQYIFEHARTPLDKYAPEDVERRFRRKFPDKYGTAVASETLVPIVSSPEKIAVLVAGGPGKQSMHLPSVGFTKSVTAPIALPTGEYAKSVEDFRR